MKIGDFYYDLPEKLIAQHPASERDGSRLMYVPRGAAETKGMIFRELPKLLRKGDCLVMNDTRVIPARLIGTKEGMQSPVEFLLLKRKSLKEWEVIVRPGRKLRKGVHVEFLPGELSADILDVLPGGNRLVRFEFEGVWEEILERAGRMPLPPYIHEKLEDPERYNTVYSVHDGSAAAPTAGLHFTPELLQESREMGVDEAFVTLHVGLGTFRPVKEENILDHKMHSEYYELKQETCDVINACRRRGGRVIAVGTTTCRVLESAKMEGDWLMPCSGETDIFIYPSYKFKILDALITNFHLPKSTLLMLVSALVGRERILDVYNQAVREEYRFFSFGDAMFLEAEEENWQGLHEGKHYRSSPPQDKEQL